MRADAHMEPSCHNTGGPLTIKVGALAGDAHAHGETGGGPLVQGEDGHALLTPSGGRPRTLHRVAGPQVAPRGVPVLHHLQKDTTNSMKIVSAPPPAVRVRGSGREMRRFESMQTVERRDTLCSCGTYGL